MKQPIEIRKEIVKDINSVRALNEKAFDGPHEANIVDDLRRNCAELLSLVAIDNENIIGHILFSPVTIEGEHGVIKGMGLAPMSVLPELQRLGIGAQLIKTGMEHLRKAHCPFIIVLGHTEYYPRFGFEPAFRYGIRCQWEGVPDNAFMIYWLDESMKHRMKGIAEYRDEFKVAE